MKFLEFINIFLRILFGIYLITFGLKGLSEVNINEKDIIKTIESIESNILEPYSLNLNLKLIKQHPIEILYFENISILYAGFLLIFGLKLSKAFLMIAFLIEFIFQKNLFFEPNIKNLFSLSLYGGLVIGASNI
jgi:hypothetical protein